MADETQALGQLQKEEGQAKDLEAEGNVVIGKTVEGEKETPKKTADKEKSEEKKPEEATDKENVELLKKELEKRDKRIKDQERMIGKQSAEVGEVHQLRQALKKVQEATTPSEKQKTKDELQEAYEDEKKALIDSGYSEKEADAALKPYLRLIDAADKRRTREQIQSEAQEQLNELGDYIENSNEFDLKIVDAHSDKILDRYLKYDLKYRLKDPKGAFQDAYKFVLREEGAKARKARKPEEEEKRSADIDSQAATSPKSKSKAEDKSAYSAENIRNAGTGRIFET